MKQIKPSKAIGANGVQWPRNEVESIKARKRDLIVRIADWTKDKEEPAYDVEVYIGGVYDWNESKTFTKFEHKSLATCKALAIEYAGKQIAKLL